MPSQPAHSQDDYAAGLQNLLPRGPVWPRDPDSLLYKVLRAFAGAPALLDVAAVNLLGDAFPLAPVMMLPEWEASLGLPDPCAGVAPSVQARQRQVAARFANSGGQSAAYFEAYAAALGYTVTVQSLGPFRLGQSCLGSQLGGEDWCFAWSITAPATTEHFFRVGSSSAGDPLADWGNNVLECELQAVAPSHGILIFKYTD